MNAKINTTVDGVEAVFTFEEKALHMKAEGFPEYKISYHALYDILVGQPEFPGIPNGIHAV